MFIIVGLIPSTVWRKGKYKVIQGQLRDPHWYTEPTKDRLNSSDSGLRKQIIENILRVTEPFCGVDFHNKLSMFLSNSFLYKSYITKYGFQTLLFDIENDPQERNNIASVHPEIVNELLSEIERYEKDSLKGVPYWMLIRNLGDTFVTG